MASININGHKVDARSQLEGGEHFVEDASNSKFLLIQCQGILQTDQYDSFEKLKVSVLLYLKPNTYLCHYEPSNLAVIRSLPFVVYANVFHESLALNKRLALSLRASQPPATGHTKSTGSTDTSGDDQEPSQAVYRDVNVGLHQKSKHTALELKTFVKELLGLDDTKIITDGHRLRMIAKEEDLRKIARLDDVRHIEEVPRRVFKSFLARDILNFPRENQETQMDPQEFDASGEVIAVTDSGIDNGAVAGLHPAFDPGRVICLGRDGNRTTGAAVADLTGHGTSVCGCVSGSCISTEYPERSLIQGSAPNATLIVQYIDNDNSVLSFSPGNPIAKSKPPPTVSAGQLLVSLRDLMMFPYQHGAHVHNNSWGAGPLLLPGATAPEQIPYDESAWELDSVISENPDYLIVFAAGNEGDLDPDSLPAIGSESAAKNILTIGATETSRKMTVERQDFTERDPFYYDATFPSNDTLEGSPDVMAYFSSRGPTKEGRCKPELVAPGEIIYSPRSRDITAENLPKNGRAGVAMDPNWSYQSGTSFAAPLVSGCAAVVRKLLRWKRKDNYTPSAALIKAILINSAIDLYERNDMVARYWAPVLTPAPDPNQGFGRVNIAKAVVNIKDTKYGYYFETENTDGSSSSNQAHPVPPITQNGSQPITLNITNLPDPNSTTIPPGNLPINLKATLVYTDAPSVDLQSVLTLRASYTNTAGATVTTYANGANKADHGATPDLANNVQKLVLKKISAGDVTLNIDAHQITGNKASSQHYAFASYVEYGPPSNIDLFERADFLDFSDKGSSTWALDQLARYHVN